MHVKKRELTLNSTFELNGHWWLPECPDNRLGGTLRYSPNEIVLNLHGTLSSKPHTRSGTLRDDLDRVGLIHGRTDAGPCTLVRAFSTERTSNLSETTHSTYSAIYLILGALADDVELPMDSALFSCSHLDDFFVSAPFIVEDDEQGGVFRGKTVRYVVPKSQHYEIPSARLEFAQYLASSESGTTIRLYAKHHIWIRSAIKQPFRWHLERIWKMCHLLTLLTDEQVSPERIEVCLSENSSPQLLFYQTVESQLVNRHPPNHLLFHFGHVSDQMSDILDRWFTASPTLTSAIDLFIDAQQQRGSSDGRFISLTKAFEAFSRATTQSLYMEASEYEGVKSEIIAAIPNRVAPDHRESLKNRIRFGNEISFRKRLTQAVSSLTAEASQCVCKSPESFVTGIVDTRNYLTHYTEELRAMALREKNLLWASERLGMLLRFLLLREVGIDMVKAVTHGEKPLPPGTISISLPQAPRTKCDWVAGVMACQ